jgi:aquaporin Z/aquaporin NIP
MNVDTVVSLRARDVAIVDHRRFGLHGHPFAARLTHVAAVEGLGTFVLVLGIIGAAIPATLGKPIAGDAFGSLAVPMAGGIVLALLVAVFGPVSGAHFNPAVTVGLAVTRRFPWRRVPAYLAAQLVGAITAALIAW